MVLPSGEQYELTAGGYRATVVEVGGGVRSCERDGRAVLQGYAAGEVCDAAHGAPLIPWPNRLADGQYRFGGVDYQVPLTEPEKHNAIHGFLRWRSWQARERTPDHVVMTIRLHPMEGYPFALDVAVEYTLDEDGLTARTTATNIGETACPYGCGQHPYLAAGEESIDDCDLELVASTRILTSADRQLPTGTEPVAGTSFDFREPRRIGGLQIDHAFSGLTRDTAGRAWVRLHRTDGRTVQLWVDPGYPIVELYTADELSPERRRRGLGAEPMTCPPNAFQAGQDVIRLEPGASATTAWGVQLVRRSEAGSAG
jgi:aldose 1-epimerase